jgi:sRNA-binding regulator protein Hfq
MSENMKADTRPAESTQSRRKVPPPVETFAEVYYYKKQIDSRTKMVVVLQDGEEIRGTIEWYDLDAIKVNRDGSPNIMLPKHSIKYMYKADEGK